MGTYNALIGEHAFYSAKHTSMSCLSLIIRCVARQLLPNGCICIRPHSLWLYGSYQILNAIGVQLHMSCTAVAMS